MHQRRNTRSSVGRLTGGLVALLLCATPLAAAAGLDYGDAPDGRQTGIGLLGRFPSLLASDGARAADVSQAWLGEGVDVEEDSRQVDRDRLDDGVLVRLTPCAESTALVEVTVPAASRGGTGYLNLFFDWDRSGSWGGQDACAPEWRVRNVPVDLAAQAGTTRVYEIRFRAGKETTGLWHRAILSVGQRLTSEAGAGALAAGEVEDYVIPRPKRGGRFGARCDPSPLVIQHGQAGLIRIRPTPGSAAITSVGLANSTPGRTGPRGARTGSRRIAVAGGNVVYTSRQVHPLGRVVEETVRVRVRFGGLASIEIQCRVKVVHPRVKVQRLVPTPGTCTLTGATSEWLPQPYSVTPSGGSVVTIRGRITLTSTAWKAQCGVGDGPPYGIVVEMPPGMTGRAVGVLAGPAGHVFAAPSCDATASAAPRCLGTEPMSTDSLFDLFVETDAPVTPGEVFPAGIVELHVILLGVNGAPLGFIVSIRKSAL